MIYVHVLIMLWVVDYKAITVVQQEFSSFEACETARVAIASAHNARSYRTIISQGCYKK